MKSLGERQREYELAYEFKITKRIPIAIKICLKNYKKLVAPLQKPFCLAFDEVMAQTALYVISQIQDGVFAYVFHDEIILILKNDKDFDHEPWMNNNIQDIASVVASFSTQGFNKSLDIFGSDLTLPGDAFFSALLFAIPDVTEVSNYLIHCQDSSIKNAINKAASYEFEQKFGRDKAFELFKHSSYEEKEELLLTSCGIDFETYYPISFIYGTAIYKKPVIFEKNDGESLIKNKWFVDEDLPNFIDDKSFLATIIGNGADIFRAEKN